MWEIAKAVVIKAIVLALFELGKWVHKFRGEKDVEFDKLHEKLQSGDLKFGDSVTIIGTYSEFVPFVNMSEIVRLSKKSDISSFPTCGTCKVGPIEDEYIGALLEENAKGIFRRSKSIPIFFSQKYSANSIKMLNFIAGDIVELRGRISPLPNIWKDIILTGDFFSFDRGDGLMYPFCLKVYDSEPYGIHLNEFRSDLWSLVHFQGAPIPLTTPDQISIIEVDAPTRLIIEEVFPGAFQFIFPEVNLVNTERLSECKSLLRSFVSRFPNSYFGATKLIDDRKMPATPKRRELVEYVYDASFDHFELKPINVKRLTKRYFDKIDKTHEAVFGHLPADLMLKEWKRVRSDIIKEAEKYPRVLGDALFLGSLGQLVDKDEFDEALLKKSKVSLKDLSLHQDIGFMYRKVLGHYIRKYGRDEETFKTSEAVDLITTSRDAPEFGNLIWWATILSLAREGKLKLIRGENGKIMVKPSEGYKRERESRTKKDTKKTRT